VLATPSADYEDLHQLKRLGQLLSRHRH
jgi:hypothetical protein